MAYGRGDMPKGGAGRVNDRKRRGADWTDGALERASFLALEEYFFYLVLQVNRRRDVALARALEPVGLSLPKWRALAVRSQGGRFAGFVEHLGHRLDAGSIHLVELVHVYQDLVQVGPQPRHFRFGQFQIGQVRDIPNLVFGDFHASAFFRACL